MSATSVSRIRVGPVASAEATQKGRPTTTTTLERPPAQRVGRLPCDRLCAQLDDCGFAVSEPLLSATECDELAPIANAALAVAQDQRRRPLLSRPSAALEQQRTALGIIFHDAR
jgi:hypothetical protein